MKFPNLFRRYIASLIDAIVIIALVSGIGMLPLVDLWHVSGVVIVFFVLGAYEPLLTAFACTIGQFAMRIRVRRVGGRRSIGIGRALLRTLVKYFLGAISFLTMPAQKEKRAMHDLAAGTLVLNSKDID